ncbi:hypothetical protein G6F56_004295 [Rhizopus delemar]|nr:hypothetical protein G6F56_004295 [Rhizopus delemar]
MNNMEQHRQTPSTTVNDRLDEERSLGSSQTIQPTKRSMLHKLKSFYSEKQSNLTDQEQEVYFSRRRVMAVFMMVFGTLMAIAFILIALGKSVRSGNATENTIISPTNNSTATSNA